MHTTDAARAIGAIAFACALAAPAQALPGARDRVYTADQNSNTVSVIDPSTNTLLGQIRLGNQRPDILSPLYKGEVNVHGLGFSPDHKTLIAVANGSNSVSFIDTATNKVKGVSYIGRSPHEGFFTADGREVWVVVRGEDYVSVIDPKTFREKRRIQTTGGPGMVMFHPNGKLAFVVSSFNPVVDVIDVKSHKVVKHIPVTSPFSPFLQFTPDLKEVWMTHKDVGKVTRIDTAALAVKGVIDTGFITNHLAFAKTAGGVRAYVTIGGENVVKVYSTGNAPALVATIPTGALPHGIWSSDDGSRVYVGLENGDGVDVIDTAANKVVARVAAARGLALQAETGYRVQRVCQRPGHAGRQPQDQSEGHGQRHRHRADARSLEHPVGQAARRQPHPRHGGQCAGGSAQGRADGRAIKARGKTLRSGAGHASQESCPAIGPGLLVAQPEPASPAVADGRPAGREGPGVWR
jgi:YVTN family beta-propeller protein